jgi:hypothetical protein
LRPRHRPIGRFFSWAIVPAAKPEGSGLFRRRDMEYDSTARDGGPESDETRLDEGAGADLAADERPGAGAAGDDPDGGDDDGFDDGGGDSPCFDGETCEVEVDGIVHEVPAALKGAFMMQADYTRKTQEVAELRKAVEAERQRVQQAGAAEVAARAQLLALDEQIARFQRVDWDAWENGDPFEAQKGWRQYQQLQQVRGQAAGRLVHLAQQRGIEEQRETATLIEQGRAELARDIRGWSDTLAASLLETGVRQYGFDRAEIEEFTDPRMVKVLHDAHQFHLLQGKQKQARRHEAAQGVRPAARIGGATPPATGLDDRLSAEEWTRRREAQVRKRRG